MTLGTGTGDEGPQRGRNTLRQGGVLGAALTGVGAALAAAVASACCAGPVVAPLVVAVLGAGGAAWAVGLKPYSPYILAASFLLLAYGMWSVYRPWPACDVDAGGGRGGRSANVVKGVLWVASVLWATSLVLNLVLS